MRKEISGEMTMTNNEECPVAEAKRRTREFARSERARIPARVREAKSRAICEEIERIFGIATGDRPSGPNAGMLGRCRPDSECGRLRRGDAVALYAAFNDEVDLGLLTQRCYEAELRVAFPCMNPRSAPFPMCMREVPPRDWIDSSAPFLADPLARLELDDERLGGFPVVDPADLSAIVVPLVAFDEARLRLGYGGGNYDSFLPLAGPKCLIVGAAFQEQRVESVPSESHDLALPSIVFA